MSTDAFDTNESVLDPEERARYADAIVLGCLRLAEGDTLFVNGEIAHRELVVALTEAGYRAGARHVDVSYHDPRAQAARVRHARDEHLGPVTPWQRARLRAKLEPASVSVTLLGEADPGVFDGLPPERVAEDSLRTVRKVKWFANASLDGRLNWAGAGWPAAYWASQIFPGLDGVAAQRRLAQDLLWFCRLGPDDPPGFEGWRRHVEAVARRAKALTDMRLERLKLRGPGTSLDLALAPGTRWLGGQEATKHGRVIAPNMPTEECFTSPEA
ncbi:MAG: aminopeptidase, partial [Gaiellaceae bacterium]